MGNNEVKRGFKELLQECELSKCFLELRKDN